MIGTLNIEGTVRIILSEIDRQILKKEESIDGIIIDLKENCSKKYLILNIINNKITCYDCEIHKSYYINSVFLTRKKLNEVFEKGKLELEYIDEYKKNGKNIELLYTGTNDEAKKIMNIILMQYIKS